MVPATAADIRVVKGATENVLTTNMFFNDSARYTHFIRAGSGVQRIQDADGTRTNVEGGGFLTGGMQMTRHTYNRDALNFIGNPYTTTHGPLVNFAQPGDSGSGLFVWDNQEKKWLFAATLATITHNTNNYIAYRHQFYENLLNRDTAGTIHNTKANSVFTWTPNTEISTISDGTTTLNVSLFNAILAERGDANPKAQHGKNVFFTGENGTLTLADSINQGAGYLNFNANWTVNSTNNDTTWRGAGVIVEQDKTVTWQVKNPQNDRLSKLGTGTLYVNGSGANFGSISVGDGKMILDQQTDNAGNKQAFSELGIVSGRPTVVLNSSDQMNPDNIYFGYRGGRLDVNGNDIVFNHIQSIDDGARIVNHNDAQEATITLAGNRVLPNATEGDLLWGDWGTRNQEKDIYVYNYWGNTYYLARKRTSPSWFPTDGRSNDDWEVLSTNNRQAAIEKALEKRNAKIATQNTARKLDAYNGYLGETDSSLTNGKLNVTYNPTIDGSSLLISGGANLNGTLTVEKGTLHLSGRPVAYARNRQTNTEIIKDEDWLNRTFTATTFKVSDNAKLEVGRNVTEINGNIEVADNAVAVLGFTQGKSTQCIRSDYTGEVSCEENHRITDASLASWQKTQVKGDALLTDNAQLTLGSKAEMTGAITAEKTTALLLNDNAVLNLNKDSVTGTVTAAENSTINLASGKVLTTLTDSRLGNLNIDNATVNLNTADVTTPNTLTVNNLTGSGTFNFVVDVVNAVSDVVNVLDTANGNFTATLTLIGKATDNNPIKLFDALTFDHFNLTLNEPIKWGDYQYHLEKENNSYWLKSTKIPQANIIPELQTQVNALFNITETLDSQLRGENTDNWKLWSNLDNRTTELAFPTQNAKQRGLLTQVGIEKNLGNNSWLGVILSQSRNNNDFHQAIGKNILTTLSLYAKKQWNNGFFMGIDVSGGQSRNQLTLKGETTKFQRNIVATSINLGQEWDIAGIRIKPSVGVRYHHLSATQYELQGDKIHTPNTTVVSYNAGISIAKIFKVAGLNIKPSFNSSYIHTNQKLETKLNNTTFNQALGSHFKQEVGLSIGGMQFNIQLNAGFVNGKRLNFKIQRH